MGEKEIVAILVGPAGWSYADWVGKVYPKGSKPRDHLNLISQYFDCIEVNVTFYRQVSARMVGDWIRRVDKPQFKFNFKVNQAVTHNDPPNMAEARKFIETIKPAIDFKSLGTVLLQFPFSFVKTATTVDRLKSIVSEFSALNPVVEFRHKGWLSDETFSLLKSMNAAFCNIDQPVGKASVPPTTVRTSDIAYIRLHGRNYNAWFSKTADRDDKYNYLYSVEELRFWVHAANNLARHAKFLYFITNNHYGGKGLVNALQVKSLLTESKVAVPPLLLENYPVLKECAVPSTDSQQTLF